jgi:UDP-glucose 4-epimerase
LHHRTRAGRAGKLQLASALKGKRVLVTGGAGFIGSHLVDKLVDAGCSEIIVLDNLLAGRPDNLLRSMHSGKVTLVVGDIRNEILLSELTEGIDTVFHHAAPDAAHCVAEPRVAFEVLVVATFNLVEQCVKSKVRKIVIASTASVYGAADVFPTSERHNPYANRTLFGAAKCFGEGLLRSFNAMYGTNYVALRYFDVYGPRMDSGTRYAKPLIRWIERLAAGLPPIVTGDGRQTVDMLHVEDAARANILAANSAVSDVALNIASGEEISVLALSRTLCRVMGRPDLEPVLWDEPVLSSVQRQHADMNAARQALGFEINISLVEGLRSLVEWWREQSGTSQEHPMGFG